jgi:hypothetical protein
MRGSVIRNSGKASRTRTPKLAELGKRRKAIEEAADLGTLYAIMNMIVTCKEKAEGLRSFAMARVRLNAIAAEASTVIDDIRKEFEKHTA